MNNHTPELIQAQLPFDEIEYAPWVAKHGLLYPYGECQCGCGQAASIALYTSVRDSCITGKPVRFIRGHGGRVDPLKRFWAKVDKRGSDDCWHWNAAKTSDGYGSFNSGGTIGLAHRFSYLIHYGPIPDGMLVCHKCDNPSCVNPDHLFAGTQLENMQDMSAKNRANHNPLKGEQSPNAKLRTNDVIAIRSRFAQGETQTALAKTFNVSFQHVSEIVNRKRWKHI